MNNKHWQKFYKTNKPIKKSSPFAKYAAPLFRENSLIYDLGSGNGRDSIFFAKKGFDVISVDPNGEPYKHMDNLMHMKININTLTKKTKQVKNSIIYSRFFIHAIDKRQTKQLIEWMSSGLFIAEFRIKGDEPVLYKDHKRTLWDEDEFKKLFNRREWKSRFWVSRGVAKYKNEDPLIMRVIAKRI